MKQGARCEPLFQNTRCVEQSGGAVELRTFGYEIGKVGSGGGVGPLGGENRWTQKGRINLAVWPFFNRRGGFSRALHLPHATSTCLERERCLLLRGAGARDGKSLLFYQKKAGTPVC